MFKFNMRKIRKSKNIKQAELAKEMKTVQQVVSDFETGKRIPNLEKLVEIAQILDVSLDELVEFKRIHHEYSKELNSKKGD